MSLRRSSSRPADIVVDESSADGAVVTFDLPAVTDDIDLAPNVSAKPASGSLFPVGPSIVTVTATDSAGNSSAVTFTVTVADHTPPTVQCGVADGTWHAADVVIAPRRAIPGQG